MNTVLGKCQSCGQVTHLLQLDEGLLCRACAWERRHHTPLSQAGVDATFELEAPQILEKLAAGYSMTVPAFMQVIQEAYEAWRRQHADPDAQA